MSIEPETTRHNHAKHLEVIVASGCEKTAEMINYPVSSRAYAPGPPKASVPGRDNEEQCDVSHPNHTDDSPGHCTGGRGDQLAGTTTSRRSTRGTGSARRRTGRRAWRSRRLGWTRRTRRQPDRAGWQRGRGERAQADRSPESEGQADLGRPEQEAGRGIPAISPAGRHGQGAGGPASPGRGAANSAN